MARKGHPEEGSFGRDQLPFIPLLTLFSMLGAGVARAELRFVKFDDKTQWTAIWCAMILAAGMVISALILRRPK